MSVLSIVCTHTDSLHCRQLLQGASVQTELKSDLVEDRAPAPLPELQLPEQLLGCQVRLPYLRHESAHALQNMPFGVNMHCLMQHSV